MQPMATDNGHAVLLGSTTAKSDVPVNSEQFRTKRNDEVAAEDVFFHQYFTALKKPATAKDKKKAEKKKLRDLDAEAGEDDEDEIWQAMMASAPDLEGDEFEDDDADLDLADLESDDDAGSDVDVEFRPEPG